MNLCVLMQRINDSSDRMAVQNIIWKDCAELVQYHYNIVFCKPLDILQIIMSLILLTVSILGSFEVSDRRNRVSYNLSHFLILLFFVGID